ncbi:transport permease protein [Cellulomonas chitinilytica]|uniref:Transport permease protein n=1 Tax=Cellulomonas chitinilytica TaxID=398759 RepID=A0A919P540_9CELL|nr:ABC transporter permease [Cellulomonas chitinilytica]GIG22870.1 transport permease protein [Cellulomonas chitinilytica]
MTTSADERARELAQLPFRNAGARQGFIAGTTASLRDLQANRELLSHLVRRELKSRYKDSTLGFVWSLIRPLTMLLVYYVAVGQFLGAARGTPSFAIFIYCGLTAWTLFAEAVTSGTMSVVQNAGLIKKVYVPREVFPLAAVGSAGFNFLIQLVILLAATAAAQQFPTGSRWFYLPLAAAVLFAFSTTLSLVLSAANVYLRDVQYLVEVGLALLFWASPIVYPWRLVEEHLGGTFWEQLYLANPITLVVMGFQQAFWVAGDSQPVPADLGARLGIALGIGLVLLWAGQRLFATLQSNFAQEL